MCIMSLFWQQKSYSFYITPPQSPIPLVSFTGIISVFNTTGTQANLSVISGSLPSGFALTANAVVSGITTGVIYNHQEVLPASEITNQFVVRASDGAGNISDCTVSITQFGDYPPQPGTPGFIGTFPDGSYVNVDISGSTFSNANLTYVLLSPAGSLTSGILPPGLVLNSNTGTISGYPSPSILAAASAYGFDETPFDGNISPNPFQPGFDFGNVTSEVTFPFTIAVSDGNLANVANYSMIIQRLDIFNGTNPSGNLAQPYYHPPVLLNTLYDISLNQYIQLDTVSTGSYYFYQFRALDFDNGTNGIVEMELQPSANVYTQTPQYLYNTSSGGSNISTVNTNISPITVVPSNLSLNGATGWLSGYVEPTTSSLQEYDFKVRVFEKGGEPWNDTFTVDYATYLPLTALNYADQLTMDAAVLDLPNTNFDGKTILFIEKTGFANVYYPGNTAPSVISTISLYSGNSANFNSSNFGWYSYYNTTTNAAGNVANVAYGNSSTWTSGLIWQFTRQAANSSPNPRFGNIAVSSANSTNAFYTLTVANIGNINPVYQAYNARIIPEKLVSIPNSNSLVNNYVQFLLPLVNSNGVVSFANTSNPYQSFVPVYMPITNYSNININWVTPPYLGNILPGEVSNFRLNATVNNWKETVGVGASGYAQMILTSANVINSGSGYKSNDILTIAGGTSNVAATIQVGNVGSGGTLISAFVNAVGVNYKAGDILTVVGGTYANAATIKVLSTVNNGQIQNYSIDFSGVEYSVLPNTTANPVSGGSGSGATFSLIFSPIGQILSYSILSISSGYSQLPAVINNPVTGGNGIGATFNLGFGVGSVTVTSPGQYYNGASIMFSECGEIQQASAIPLISNQSIQGIRMVSTGLGYTSIPKITIESASSTHPQNIINYQLTSGALPEGLALQSNGIITGRPCFQDQGNTFTFTVQAEVAINSPITAYEQIAINGVTLPSHIQDLTQTIFVDRNFVLNVSSANSQPISNMYLEFMLSSSDANALFAPVHDETIVSNTDIYRVSDQYFGIPQDTKMLMAYGLLTPIDANVANVVLQYHYIKDYYFTSVNWAQSLDSSGNVDYEVIYFTPTDVYTSNGQSFSGNLSFFEDGTAIEVCPATIPNMIAQLQKLGVFNPDYLPSWMTSIQPNGLVLGWIPAVPLVYLNPGTGLKVLNRLKNYYGQSQNSLNRICATSDRYFWDNDLALYYNKSTDTYSNVAISENCNKYVVFPQQTNYISNGVTNV